MAKKIEKGTEPSKNLNYPKRGLKSRLKNLAIAGAVVTTLIGPSSCGKNNNTSSNEVNTEVTAKNTEMAVKTQEIAEKHFVGKDADSRIITDSIDGIVLCENPDTKQIFLSDGNNKLTEDFDDIRDIGRFDGNIYFIGVKSGKPSIVNEKGDTIFSGLDEIEDYTIHNGDIAVCGRKGGKTCLVYNNKTIDEGREYTLHSRGNKNGIYITATSYDNYGTKNITTFVNGKDIGHNISIGYAEDGAYNGHYSISDYGEGYIIISYNDSKGTLIYNGRVVLRDLDDWGRMEKYSGIISYVKNGKKYVLFTDGKEYLVNMNEESDNGIDSYSGSDILFVEDKEKSYYILPDGELHEYEGKYESISNIGKTSDGKIYFIGNDRGQYFVVDGKKYGPLDHITGVGKTKDGTIYLRGWKEETWGHATFVKIPVILMNGTIREVDPNEEDSNLFLKLNDDELPTFVVY